MWNASAAAVQKVRRARLLRSAHANGLFSRRSVRSLRPSARDIRGMRRLRSRHISRPTTRKRSACSGRGGRDDARARGRAGDEDDVEREDLAEELGLVGDRPLLELAVFGAVDLEADARLADGGVDVLDLALVLAIEGVGDAEDR